MKFWTGTLPGRFAIGLGVLFVVYVAFSAPFVWDALFDADRVIIGNQSYSLRDIQKLNPRLYNKYLQEEAGIRKEIFSEFAERRILEMAALEEGLEDPDLVLKKGFEPREISDQDLLSVYNQYKSQLGGRSFLDTKEMIRRQLTLNQERMHTQSRQIELMQKYNVSFRIREAPPLRQPISPGDNPSQGPEDAPVTVIEFSDFECPYCKRSQEVNKKLRDKYKGKIRWVFRDFPLDFHENAMYAHMAANCAIPQNLYWEFFELLFQNTGNLTRSNVDYLATKAGLDRSQYLACMKEDEKLRSEIEADIREGQKFGVSGTPAFFINGIFVSGALPFEHFDEIIQKELK